MPPAAPRAAGRQTPLLLHALSEPRNLLGLDLAEWDLVLRQARAAAMVGRLEASLADIGALEGLPVKVRSRLNAARMLVEQQHRLIRWEVAKVQRALTGIEGPVVLLKGAAYVLADLPAARGRVFSDVDIMVPLEQLHVVEETLLRAGWQFLHLDPYDERFYRSWSHELPPMQHRQRGIVLDVHHNILPPTARLRVDPRPLLEAARALDGSRLKVLAPTDMVLHSAAHLFQSSEFDSGLRDLVDLHVLMRHFARAPGFFDALAARARQLGLERSLFYALRYTRRLLDSAVPDELTTRVQSPARPLRAAMDLLVTRALVPRRPAPRSVAVSRWLLYVRHHWQRMPPLLLARHLLHKAIARRRAAD